MTDLPKTGSEKFDDAMAAIAEPFEADRRYSQRNRKLILATILAMVGFAIATVIGGYATIQSQHAQTKADAATVLLRAQALSNCQANNGFRTNNAAMWTFVRPLLVQAKVFTPAQADEAKVLADKAFAQRDCTKP